MADETQDIILYRECVCVAHCQIHRFMSGDILLLFTNRWPTVAEPVCLHSAFKLNQTVDHPPLHVLFLWFSPIIPWTDVTGGRVVVGWDELGGRAGKGMERATAAADRLPFCHRLHLCLTGCDKIAISCAIVYLLCAISPGANHPTSHTSFSTTTAGHIIRRISVDIITNERADGRLVSVSVLSLEKNRERFPARTCVLAFRPRYLMCVQVMAVGL